MAMIQQNISGVKLERMRKKAHHRMRIAKGVRWGTFIAGTLLTLVWSVQNLIIALPAGVSSEFLIGLVAMTFGSILISFLVSFVLYLFTVLIVSKPCDEFAKNYKNKYVLVKLREFPGFSQLKYTPDQSLPAQELCHACLPPAKNLPQIRSIDYWEGSYDCVRFRAAQLDFWPYQSHLMLFDGQVMIFSLFNEHKISESPVQVFARRSGVKSKGLTFPEKIQTENEAFNQKFSVYAQDGQNAFYILTPRVIEDVLEFSEIMGTRVYLVFSGCSLYVGCEQAANPFEPREELTLEEQSQNIQLAAEMVKKARDILIHLEEDTAKRK